MSEMYSYFNSKQNLVVGIILKKIYYIEVLLYDGKKYKCEVFFLKFFLYIFENLKLVEGRFLSGLDEEKLNKVVIVFKD